MNKIKIDMEFIFKASPAIIYQFLTTPECLVRWFCDGVHINEDVYTFEWEGSEEDAELLDDIEEERLRFKWIDSEDHEYLEFRMYKSDVTNETILEVSDFCESDEEQEQRDLWNTQITEMRKECGG